MRFIKTFVSTRIQIKNQPLPKILFCLRRTGRMIYFISLKNTAAPFSKRWQSERKFSFFLQPSCKFRILKQMIQFLQQRAKSQGTRFAKDRSQSIFIESGSLFLKKSVLRSLLACKKNLENELEKKNDEKIHFSHKIMIAKLN